MESRGLCSVSNGVREVRLPSDLCKAAERQFAKQFASLEELLTFMLRYVTEERPASMDRSEVEIVQKRLKDLGYM
jgi:hypothetical protein